MMPVLETRDLVSLYACGAEPPANSFLPPSSTTGTGPSPQPPLANSCLISQSLPANGPLRHDKTSSVLAHQTIDESGRDLRTARLLRRLVFLDFEVIRMDVFGLTKKQYEV